MMCMRRFSPDELNKIRQLAMDGESLRGISNKLNCNRSAIQYHYAKIKGKRSRQKDFFVENLSDLELGWLVGLYAGDDSRNFRKKTYSYSVKFALNTHEYPIIEYVEGLLSQCGIKTWRSIEQKRVYVRCINKKLYEFTKTCLAWTGTRKSYSVRLSDLSAYNENFLFGFLCGIIDADGGTKRLHISTSSEELANNIQSICDKIGIHSKRHRYDVFHIYLKKPEYLAVCHRLGFSSIKHKN